MSKPMDPNSIVFATGGYDHSIKFWYPHDGVCYRTVQHPESVRITTYRALLASRRQPLLCEGVATRGQYRSM